MILLFSLSICIMHQSAMAVSSETSVQLPARGFSEVGSNHTLPRISFEKTVFDLGDVGPGTKNECEFRFTNTGRGRLKIGNISRTCGCTVFHLDKKEYAQGETGTIKVFYTAGKSTTSTQKSIYSPKAPRLSYFRSF